MTPHRLVLAGKKVLVTRPVGQSDNLLAELKQAGASVYHYPVLLIEPLLKDDKENHQTCKSRIIDLDQYQHVIFISTNAVKFGFEWVDQYWPQLPVGIKWHGIGRATTDVMHANGLPVELHEGIAMNSEALLRQPPLQSLSGQRILIVRGVGGREYLAEQLRGRGAQVDYLACYRRVIPDQPIGELTQLIQAMAVDAICINSGESLKNFCQLIGGQHLASIYPVVMVTPGERVARLAREYGFENVVVAANASSGETLSALQHFYGDSQ